MGRGTGPADPASGFQGPLDARPNLVGGNDIAVLRCSNPKPYRLAKTSLSIEETINRLPEEVIRLPSIPDNERRKARFLIWLQLNFHGVTD